MDFGEPPDVVGELIVIHQPSIFSLKDTHDREVTIMGHCSSSGRMGSLSILRTFLLDHFRWNAQADTPIKTSFTRLGHSIMGKFVVAIATGDAIAQKTGFLSGRMGNQGLFPR